MIYKLMAIFLLSVLLTLVNSKKGLTWEPLVWPDQDIMVGKWGCRGCDPYKGDT